MILPALAVLLLVAPDQAAAPPRQAVVLSAVENMYSGPDERRDVVSQALLGQVVEVVEAFDGFVKVQTPDRYQGWMPRGALLVYDETAAAPVQAQGGATGFTLRSESMGVALGTSSVPTALGATSSPWVASAIALSRSTSGRGSAHSSPPFSHAKSWRTVGARPLPCRISTVAR